jgi:uncharacterized membrane protein
MIYPKAAISLGILALFPGGIDGTTQMLGDRESTNMLRGITGFLMGAGTVLLVYGVVHSVNSGLY